MNLSNIDDCLFGQDSVKLYDVYSFLKCIASLWHYNIVDDQYVTNCVILLQMLFLLMMLTVFVGQAQPKSKSVSVSLETKWASTPLLLETRSGRSFRHFIAWLYVV